MNHAPSSPAAGPRQQTRRDFLTQVSRYGGSVFAAMSALDLLAQDNGSTWIPRDTPRITRAKKVIVIGAGAAGLSAAHELTKLGYECQILEARMRPGGRIWTVRRGAVETELTGLSQLCRFEEGHYLNAGPARIPQHHYTTLGYCREFGVPLEVFNNYNDAAYVHESKGNTRRRMREARCDYEGHLGELLAKAVAADKLDMPLSAADKDKLFGYLRVTAGLDEKHAYGSISGRGYSVWPGAPGQEGKLTAPDDFATMLASGFATHFGTQRNIVQQAVMFQPVGGIDALPRAMAKTLEPIIRYGAEVTALRKTADGRARVEYKQGGVAQQAEGDFCVCTLPASVLREVPNDLSPDFKAAQEKIAYGTSNKIGLQFKRRFWEEDDWIYGGPSWTDQPITQLWYPNYGYQGRKGVIVGYYVGDTAGATISGMTPEQRTEFALACGEKLHAQYRTEFDNAFSVSWKNIKYNNGALSRYESIEEKRRILGIIGEADGPLYFAGEHVSWISGWIAGAFESSLRVVRMIHQRSLA